MRSRAAHNADGSVRFALSVPVVGDDGFEIQHVALASDDVLAAAAAMRDRGVPLRAIHDNYYDDLLARTDLDAELVERMRELDVRVRRRAAARLHRDGRARACASRSSSVPRHVNDRCVSPDRGCSVSVDAVRALTG